MSTPLVVVGAGGFGRETLDVIEAINSLGAGPGFLLLGVIDDGPSALNLNRLAARGVQYLGTVSSWLQCPHPAEYLIGVGDPAIRRALARRFDTSGHAAAIAVHPRAQLGSGGAIDAGTIVCAGVQVSTNVRLGAHVHLNPNVTIGHDARLADYVSVNPAATISGECQVGECALLGSASVVLQGLSVGAGSVVGAAACVVRDIDPESTVKGVPAR